jgi:hypothetical protein
MEPMLVVAMAMSMECPSDRIRLENMGHDFMTVSQMDLATPHADHVSCNFRSGRGIRTLCGQLLARHNRYNRVVVVLDYFWLQTHYYSTNYGTDWLSFRGSTENGKAYSILDAGASEVLLPVEGGTANTTSTDVVEMIHRYENTLDKGLLSIDFVGLDYNPLWCGSEGVARQLNRVGRTDNITATANFLNAVTPFLRIQLTRPPRDVPPPTTDVRWSLLWSLQ